MRQILASQVSVVSLVGSQLAQEARAVGQLSPSDFEGYRNDIKHSHDKLSRKSAVSHIVILIVFLCTLIVPAQTQPTAELVDEMSEVCNEDLIARIDNFFIRLNGQPAARGVVLFHGRKDTLGRNAYLSSFISSVYPKVRGYDASRLKLIHAPRKDEQSIQFWLVPRGANVPSVSPAGELAYNEAALFDRAALNSRPTRVSNLYEAGFYDLGCNFDPNRRLLAQTLRENPSLNAFLIVYTEQENQRYGPRGATLAMNDLVENFRVPRKRVRAIYGGVRKGSEIEFWLVPAGHRPPAPDLQRPPVRTY